MILPDLAREIAWYQARMKPSDERFGAGIADWTITSEYVTNLSVPGMGLVWGLTCSPSSLPAIVALTPEDISARRAHIQIRTPLNASELAEIPETIAHECSHVLFAAMGAPLDAEENAAHSLAPLLADLRKNDPARAAMLARAMTNPARARAYRAGDGSMPDNTNNENKEPDNGKEPPKAQDGGGDMTIEEIKAKMIEAVLAGQPTDELAKALVKAMAMQAAEGQRDSTIPPPPPVPQMGMTEDQAQMRARVVELEKRAKEADEQAIGAIVDANPHLDDKQKGLVKSAGSPARARELAASYQRPPEPAKPTMGAKAHPSQGGGQSQSIRARALSVDPEIDKHLRRATSGDDTLGLVLDVPGHILAYSPTQHLNEMRGASRAEKGGAQ